MELDASGSILTLHAQMNRKHLDNGLTKTTLLWPFSEKSLGNQSRICFATTDFTICFAATEHTATDPRNQMEEAFQKLYDRTFSGRNGSYLGSLSDRSGILIQVYPIHQTGSMSLQFLSDLSSRTPQMLFQNLCESEWGIWRRPRSLWWRHRSAHHRCLVSWS